MTDELAQPEETPDEQRISAFDKATTNAVKLADKAIAKAAELLDQDKARESSYASATARNAAVVAGVSFDKRQVALGLPTEIVGDGRDASDIIDSLRRLGIDLALEGTAEELPPKELPPSRADDLQPPT